MAQVPQTQQVWYEAQPHQHHLISPPNFGYQDMPMIKQESEMLLSSPGRSYC
jgi:hypothetical protein